MLCPDNNAFEVFAFAKDVVMSGLRPHGTLRDAPPMHWYSGANRAGHCRQVRFKLMEEPVGVRPHPRAERAHWEPVLRVSPVLVQEAAMVSYANGLPEIGSSGPLARGGS